MDGLTFLRKLMAQYPLPVVVISKLIDVASSAATEILEAGAMDVVVLPKIGARAHLLASAGAIREKIKLAVRRPLRCPAQGPSQNRFAEIDGGCNPSAAQPTGQGEPDRTGGLHWCLHRRH